MSRRTYPAVPRVGVGAVVMKDDAILLVRRAKPPGQALWAIPGGVLKLGETLQEGAAREIREETGITIKVGKPIYVFDFIERDKAGRVLYHYVIIDLIGKYLAGEINAADDAAECRWVRPEECRNLPLSESTVSLLEELRFLVPEG